ncbi:MAG TPA: aromatic/alkene monooxygenase hydroxylase subunit beta [Gaiellaceae bacterium]|jgi:propane monooxygenase small subunit|nr:aromatic/alkene monooxygenase hydroxylase subunit beta [Gaiellaceae bacterium]
MSSKTPTQERSVPKPVFTDAEAGAREFPSSDSRTFTYYKPQKRRASVYEDVTVDVQPDPERYLIQGWIYGFGDGPGGYPHDWTALKSSNWHEFRDPNEEWEQTIYRTTANVVRGVQQTIANGRAADAFDGWNRGWLKVVERHVGAWAHAEHGIGLYVYTPAQRDAPTNMINNALAVAATHKLRLAQDLILYNLDVSEAVEGFDGGAHREAWQSDPVWQGVRENVEQLTATRDWAEAFFATALVFEPLVGELFRSHFVMQVAALQGDYVTPTVMGTGEADAAREQRGARRLFDQLLNDPKYAGENRAVTQQWLARWVPLSLTAARQLQPVWSQVPEKTVSFEESLGRATVRFGELLGDLGLESPKEL